MNKKFAVLALVSAMMLQVGTALAEDGPWTSSGNAGWTVLSFPFRLVTGTVGAAGGAVGGGLKGIVDTEQKFAENTFGRADENPLLVPVGLVGTVVAVPVGLVTGAPDGAVEYGKKGYHWWNRF